MVERIKTLCADNKVTIRALEKEFGFGNGTIARWNENRPSIDKVKAVADYFGVTIDELLKEE